MVVSVSWVSFWFSEATEEERRCVRHHLLATVDPLVEGSCYTSQRFREEASAVIKDIRARGKVPIVVGGTAYYLQSLLWNSLMPPAQVNEEVEKEIASMELAQKIALLEEVNVDPERACGLHKLIPFYYCRWIRGQLRALIRQMTERFLGRLKSSKRRERLSHPSWMSRRMSLPSALCLFG